MSDADKVLKEIRDMTQELYESAFSTEGNTIRAVDRGHGYITLQIPSDQKERKRRQARHRNRSAE